MSTAMLNIFVRTTRRRMAEGEELEDILASYTKLSDEDKDEIRQQIEGED